MFAFLPNGSSASERNSPWSVAMALILILPIVIITVALIPGILVCPFLPPKRQRIIVRLLVNLEQWTQVISLALTGSSSSKQR